MSPPPPPNPTPSLLRWEFPSPRLIPMSCELSLPGFEISFLSRRLGWFMASSSTLSSSAPKEGPHFPAQPPKRVHIIQLHPQRGSTLSSSTPKEGPHYPAPPPKRVHIIQLHHPGGRTAMLSSPSTWGTLWRQTSSGWTDGEVMLKQEDWNVSAMLIACSLFMFLSRSTLRCLSQISLLSVDAEPCSWIL